MTRDDILRLGVETNLFIYNGDDTSLTVLLLPTEEKLLKFAALVAAAEREACAKLCEARVIGDHNREDQEAKRCAAAIRARNEQEQPR